MGRFKVAPLLVVLLIAETLHAQKIYFTDGTPHTIRRADPDGSNIEDVVDTSPNEPYAFAIDPARNHIYWTVFGGNIYRAGLDGTGVQLVITTGWPWGVAIDAPNAKLYWTFGFDFTVGIRRANVDGSQIETLYEAGNNIAPERITIQSERNAMYWTEPFSYGLFRGSLDATGIGQILDATPPLKPFGVGVDPIGRKVYWTLNQVNGFDASGKVQRANLDGSQVEDLAVVAPGYSEIAVDPYRAKIYWTDQYVIRRANLDGTNSEEIIPTSLDRAGPIAIDPRPQIPTVSFPGAVLLSLAILGAGAWMLRRRTAAGGKGAGLLYLPLTITIFMETASKAWDCSPDVPCFVAPCSVDSGIVSVGGQSRMA